MIYDCFQFFNEIDILLIRMNVLKDVVDKFVISESTETFSGLKKPLNFQENRELFKEFEGKIIYLVVDDTPPGETHARDEFQKNAVKRGLKDCTDDDVIIFSDLDEIPTPEKVLEVATIIKENKDDARKKIFHMAQRMFYCYLNMEEVTGSLPACSGEFEGVEKKMWLGTKMLSYELAKNLNLWDIRFPEYKENGVRVADGGWHFGYMGGHNVMSLKERVTEKVKSAAHQEYNSKSFLKEAVDRIDDGQDMFGREAKFVRVEIDDTYPQYIRENQDKYRHLIKAKDTKGQKVMRKLRLKCYKFSHFIHRVGAKVLRRG